MLGLSDITPIGGRDILLGLSDITPIGGRVIYSVRFI